MIEFTVLDWIWTTAFLRLRAIHRAGAGFLQDVRSWIWMPSEVTVSVSAEGEAFCEVARLGSRVADDDTRVTLDDFIAEFEPVEARYVRISARSYGTIPEWHPGRGDGAFIFVDEILID